MAVVASLSSTFACELRTLFLSHISPPLVQHGSLWHGGAGDAPTARCHLTPTLSEDSIGEFLIYALLCVPAIPLLVQLPWSAGMLDKSLLDPWPRISPSFARMWSQSCLTRKQPKYHIKPSDSCMPLRKRPAKKLQDTELHTADRKYR